MSQSQLKTSLRSKRLLAQGLLQLMEQQPYEQITITQICQQAQLVRQTFYRNFASKEEVLLFYCQDLFEGFCSLFPKGVAVPSPDMYQFVYSSLEYITARRQVLVLLERNGLLGLLQSFLGQALDQLIPLDELCRQFQLEVPVRYLRSYIPSVFCCLLQEWVRGGFAEDLHTLTRLICRCFAGFQIPECTPEGQQPACGN